MTRSLWTGGDEEGHPVRAVACSIDRRLSLVTKAVDQCFIEIQDGQRLVVVSCDGPNNLPDHGVSQPSILRGTRQTEAAEEAGSTRPNL
jgi:hypothetical protein